MKTLKNALAVAALCACSGLLINNGLANVIPTVVLGSDYLTTIQPTTFGGAPFQGVPVGPGLTDTIVQRQLDASFPGGVGTGATIPIELVALHLVSMVPVDFGLGAGSYYITLQSERGGPVSVGQMNMTLGSPTGGTFDSFFDVFFDVRLGAENGPIALTSDLVLQNTGTPWNSDPSGLLVPGLVGDQAANLHTDLGPGQMDFYLPSPFTESHPSGAQHSVEQSVPEPGATPLIGLGLMAMAGLLRKRG